MSEQNQSNFQALGAGLLGFVAVMAIGGGAMMLSSSHRSKSMEKPAAAAAPIDIGTALPRPAPSTPGFQREERRAQSPAPLIGAESEPEAMEKALAGSAAASAQSATALEAKSRARLEVTQHLEAAGDGSTAKAVVENSIAPEKAVARAADKKKAAPRPVTATAGSDAVASVHYGVTSRSELMGRAAGPVYNVAGGGKGGTIATGKMAGDAKAKLTDLQRQMEASGMPEDQRAKMKKDLDEVNAALTVDPEKPAQ